MATRAPPKTVFEFFERGWRVALAWVLLINLGIFFTSLCALFLWGWARSILYGQPMPDLTAGLDRVVVPLAPWLSAGFAALCGLAGLRHREVTAAIQAGGGQGQPPFAPSPQPSSDGAPTPPPAAAGSYVNEHGGVPPA